MNAISSVGAPLGPDAPQIDLARLADADEQQQQQIAKELEGVFLSLLLKEMRQTIDGEGLFGGDQSDIYGGLFDLFMGRHLADNSNLGVGNLVQQYLDMDALQ
ncbi:MAG: rod-binding protein [Pirellulales bacterium]